MTEATQIFLLCTSFDSTKETMSPAAPTTQESSQLSKKLTREKQQEAHGLKSLCLVKRPDIKDLMLFDKHSSQRMRQNLKTLMEETACQQNMIQELAGHNQQLKNELQLEQNQAAHQEQRANELEQIMESVKAKIGELEDESLNRVCQQETKIKALQKGQKTLQWLYLS
uniref:Centrosomal protein of 70 kDa n=1 Tax=Sciurus vulgaris TaxID=55149 RepID=A0A8D2DB48_SCIVU